MWWKDFFKKWFHDIDHFTLVFALSFIFLGFVMSLSVSPAMGARIGLPDYHFTLHHTVFAVMCIFIMLFCSMLSINSIRSFSYIGGFCCLCFLILVLFVGSSTKGAHRWINLGFFTLQPSELMKPFFIVLNAQLLAMASKHSRVAILSVLAICCLVFLLIIQPDFGTAAVYTGVWLAQVFLGNSKFNILIYSIITVVFFVSIIGFFVFPHFHYRIVNFLTLRGGHEQYQTRKALECIHNGGFFGTSLGEGEVKYQLPDAHTDYIFSVICEELGVVFAVIFLIAILIFVYRHIASNFTNTITNIRIIYGLVLMFVVQASIHIGVNVNILPSKGMTLPLISYGGSSMISNAIIFGFLLAFTRKGYQYQSPYKIFQDAYFK